MKYRVKNFDSTWLFFTPLAFLNMGGTNHYKVQSKRNIFSKWKDEYEAYNKSDAYIHLMKIKYGIKIPMVIKYDWDKKYKWFNHCAELKLYTDTVDNVTVYIATYQLTNSRKCNYYEKSTVSYEDALIKLRRRLNSQKLAIDLYEE